MSTTTWTSKDEAKFKAVAEPDFDWNSFGDNNQKTQFLKLEQGTTTVRILPQKLKSFKVFWVKDSDDKNRKIVDPSPKMSSLLVSNGHKPSTKYLIKVIDRSDDTLKVVEIGTQVHGDVSKLIANPKWGVPVNYDIDIIRGKPKTTPLYSVQPNPKEKLPKELMQLGDDLDVNKFIKPTSDEEVMAILSLDNKNIKSNDTDEDGFDFDFS